MKKTLYSAVFGLALVALVLVPATPAHAQTYSNAQLQAQVQLLLQQVALLQALLAQRGGYSYDVDYDYGCRSSCDHDIDRIEVDFVGRIAQIRVVYDSNRDDRRYALYADTVREVATALARELNLSVATIERLIDEDFDYDERSDFRSIDVSFDDDDAHVVVRFRDGDTDRFTLRNVDDDEDEVIEELADRYNVREREIEDVIDFRFGSRNDDIDEIDVEFDRDDAHIVVRFDNGTVHRFTLRNVDEDEDDVIEYLADRYDVDEDDIEDVIDFEDRDNDDIRSIDVSFFSDDADVVVRFRDGRTERFTLRNVDDDEDEMIEYLADRYDVDEDDIEDVIDFD